MPPLFRLIEPVPPELVGCSTQKMFVHLYHGTHGRVVEIGMALPSQRDNL